MPDWPFPAGQVIESAGVDTANSRGTGVTASASVNTKGSWTQIIAATAYESNCVFVNVRAPSAATQSYLVDIGFGGAGSEFVVIPNLVIGSMTGTVAKHGGIWLPIHVPRGTRISARCQSSVASGIVRVMVHTMAAGFINGVGLSRVIDYGTVLSTSEGTTVDPGATINTKGSWVQLSASITNPMRAFFLGFSSLKNGASTSANFLLDVGVGAAASERTVLSNLHFEVSSTDDTVTPSLMGPFFAEIAAGVRLAVRAQSSGADVTDRLFGAMVYGIG